MGVGGVCGCTGGDVALEGSTSAGIVDGLSIEESSFMGDL